MITWTPGQIIATITCEAGGPRPPAQLNIPAQAVPYAVSISWGGRSKSDEGAVGSALLIYRDTTNPANSDIEIRRAPVHREFPDDQTKKEDWVVTGEVGFYKIPANTSWRVTNLYQITNDHWVNSHLAVRFLTEL